MNIKEINYKGTDIESLYKYALIGADFATEKNAEGITLIDSIKKQLYIKTVLLSRLLDVVDVPEDRVMSLEQYKGNDVTITEFKGTGIRKLKKDFSIFIDILNDEIQNVISCNNDVLKRYEETLALEITPEKFNEQLEELKKLTEEMDKIKG